MRFHNLFAVYSLIDSDHLCDNLSSMKWKLVYLGITSGFCGSLTTFSGWQVQAAQSMLRSHIAAGILNLIIGFMTFYFCLLTGMYLGKLIHHSLEKKPPQNVEKADATLPSPRLATPLNVSVLVLASSLWIIFGVLFAVIPSSRRWVGPAFLTPFGAGLRWYSSIWNAQCLKFKWPTFIVNIFGVLVYSILVVCETKYTGPTDIVRTSSFTSILSGFCGSLTTASTFFLELKLLSPRYFADIYALSSIVAAQAIAFTVIAVAKFGFSISAL